MKISWVAIILVYENHEFGNLSSLGVGSNALKAPHIRLKVNMTSFLLHKEKLSYYFNYL